MKKPIITFIAVIISFFAFSGQSTKKVALVKISKGAAETIAPDGASFKIKRGMWLKEGSIIKTAKKSFVRLSFIDKSSMNIGPNSEIKIEKFSKKDAGVINVLSGKIRSQVTKDYLRMDKDKSKLFIKSKSAVMGIRGTDFLFSANKKTGASTAILFEGSVVFKQINKKTNLKNLEAVVNRGRRIKPGEFSVASFKRKKETVAAKMSSTQFKALMKNDKMVESDSKSAKKSRSVVPPGLSGEVVKNKGEGLKDALGVKGKKKENKREISSEDFAESKGYVKGDDVKPVDGSIVHIDSGTIIPLGVDSTFDKNKGEWVSQSVGSVANNGDYVPPQGYDISETGDILKKSKNGELKKIIIEDKPLDKQKPLEEIQTVKKGEKKKAPINLVKLKKNNPCAHNPLQCKKKETDRLRLPPRAPAGKARVRFKVREK